MKVGTGNFVSVAGLISTEDNKNVSGVMMNLTNLNSFVISEKRDTTISIHYDTMVRPSGAIFYIQRKDTNIVVTKDTLKASITKSKLNESSGKYSFTNLVQNKDYMISPRSDLKDLKGVDTEDAIILLRHLLGVEAITLPYKKIAADVNSDGVINSADFDLLYAVLNGTKAIDAIPKLWKFIPRSTNPPILSKEMREYLMYNPLKNTVSNADFVAIKIGDLNGSVSNILNSTISSRTSQKIFANSDINYFQAGKIYKIELKLSQALNALALHPNSFLTFLDLDSSWLLDKDKNIAVSRSSEGSNTVLISLLFHKNMEISDVALQSLLTDLDSRQISLLANKDSYAGFKILRTYPNPLTESNILNIQLFTKEDTKLIFKLFDVNGKTLQQNISNIQAGFTIWDINVSKDIAPGVYYYQLYNNKEAEYGKLNIIK